jgi:hypothetical protein
MVLTPKTIVSLTFVKNISKIKQIQTVRKKL